MPCLIYKMSLDNPYHDSSRDKLIGVCTKQEEKEILRKLNDKNKSSPHMRQLETEKEAVKKQIDALRAKNSVIDWKQIPQWLHNQIKQLKSAAEINVNKEIADKQKRISDLDIKIAALQKSNPYYSVFVTRLKV